jgi:hypothetical protein
MITVGGAEVMSRAVAERDGPFAGGRVFENLRARSNR